MSDIAVIIGLGYVGLPLAREATRSALRVIGSDVKTEVVTGLEAGRSHVDDLTVTSAPRMAVASNYPVQGAACWS
jgi:UDP-N-acetyl-D-glucosamine dehydrogenase